MKNIEKEYEFIKSKLSDQAWRLNNLYKIKGVDGEVITFRMNEAQEYLFKNKHYFNVILKARQLGFTTFIMIYFLDSCLFTNGIACGVIAHTREDTEQLFSNKIKFAYNNLPEWIKLAVTATSDTAKKLNFSNGSSIVVGTSLRGGTFQKLHISEYGKIAARYPEKAKEIKSGSLNTVHVGQEIFVESTAEGRQGEFFDLCESARKLQDMKLELSPLDPKFHFFSWYMNKHYRLEEPYISNTSISHEMNEYFNSLPVKIEAGQKAWYIKKSETMSDLMKREFPSTPAEAFEQSLEGAYYTKQMEIVRRNGQLRNIPHDPRFKVYTFWDIGQGRDDMAIWFMQEINQQYRFIRYHESSGEGWEFYSNLLSSYNYAYGGHYMPHDGNKTIIGKDVMTTKQIAQSLGINPVTIVTRSTNIQADINNNCRLVLPMCHFDENNCKIGINHLDSYRKEWCDKFGVWKDKPRHDQSSHGADAFRTFVMGYQGLKPKESYIEETPFFVNNDYDILDY